MKRRWALGIRRVLEPIIGKERINSKKLEEVEDRYYIAMMKLNNLL